MRAKISFGCSASSASGPSPTRSITPGRKPSTKTSAAPAKRRTMDAPCGVLKSTATERRPRLRGSRGRCGLRPGLLARSTTTTSAPRSASIMHAKGAGAALAISSTRTPCNGPAITTSARSCCRRFQHVDGAGRCQANHMSQTDLGPVNLTVSGLAAQMGRHLVEVGDASGPDRMALGQQSAGYVDRQRSIPGRRTGVDEVASAAGLAQAKIVVVDQFGGGEAIVQLHQIEILRTDARSLVSLIRRHPRQGVDVGLDLSARGPRV